MLQPLLVVQDIVVLGGGGLVLLPSVAREGLPIVPGDVLELCTDEEREEVVVLSLDPDRSAPERVRIRIAGGRHARPGVEVWTSETCSRVVARAPARSGVRFR